MAVTLWGINDLAGLPSPSANWRAKRFAYACSILFETDTYATSRHQACEILQAQLENDIFEDTLLVSGVLCDVIKEETRNKAYLVSPTAPFGFSGGILR
jgi:hypothetical protein